MPPRNHPGANVPPSSRKQQRFIFMEAKKGVPWAAKYVGDAPTMRVQLKGQKQPSPKPQYDTEKRQIVKQALRRRRGR